MIANQYFLIDDGRSLIIAPSLTVGFPISRRNLICLMNLNSSRSSKS